MALPSSRASVAGSVRSSSARTEVRHDALRTGALAREKNVNGIAVGSVLHPVNGYRGELERKGIVPKDHARMNVEAMREKQREVRARRAEEEEAKHAEAFKLKRFAGVESRVKEAIAGPAVR